MFPRSDTKHTNKHPETEKTRLLIATGSLILVIPNQYSPTEPWLLPFGPDLCMRHDPFDTQRDQSSRRVRSLRSGRFRCFNAQGWQSDELQFFSS